MTTSSIKSRSDMQSGISRHLDLTHLNSSTIIENRAGMLMSTIQLEGHTFDTETDERLNELLNQWHMAVRASFGDGFGLYATLHRQKKDIKMAGEFNGLSRELNSQYFSSFEGQTYENLIYLSIIKKPISANGASGKMRGVLLDIFLQKNKSVVELRKIQREEGSKQLSNVVSRLIQALSEFKPRLVGENDGELGYSELISFYSIFVNCGEPLKLNKGEYTTFKGVKEAEKKGNIYPMGAINQNICRFDHLIFGKNIQFSSGEENRYAAMLSLKNYSSASANTMFDSILDFPSELILTHSFFPVDSASAIKKIDRRIVSRINADDRAVGQTSELESLQEDLAGEELIVGFHHNTIMLVDDNQNSLEENKERIIKRYLAAGLICNQETLAQEACFWAAIPGGQKYICRSTMITSKNFCDMFPLHNYNIGNRQINHLRDAVSMATTPGQTPVFFHLHGDGSKDNPSSGHTLVFGGNGSGKTALMAFIDSQLERFKGRSYFFDRNCGCEIYIRASGGSYFALSPEQDLKFNPFSLKKGASTTDFLTDFLCEMLSGGDSSGLNDETKQQIKEGVDFVYTLPSRERTLSSFSKYLPVNFSKTHKLKSFIRGEAGEPDGNHAYLFDNSVDHLTAIKNKKVGFDFTYYLGSDKNKDLLSLISMYLFHVIENQISSTDSLDTIFLDEGWQYLDNNYFKSKLKEWLGTLRKCNAHVVFGSQSANQLLESSISSTLLDNSSTKILFANPDARREIYCDGLSCNEAEFQQIKHMRKKDHYFLYKREQSSIICKFDLSTIGKNMMILSGTPANVQWVRDQIKRNNTNWVEDLKTRGEDEN